MKYCVFVNGRCPVCGERERSCSKPAKNPCRKPRTVKTARKRGRKPLAE